MFTAAWQQNNMIENPCRVIASNILWWVKIRQSPLFVARLFFFGQKTRRASFLHNIPIKHRLLTVVSSWWFFLPNCSKLNVYFFYKTFVCHFWIQPLMHIVAYRLWCKIFQEYHSNMLSVTSRLHSQNKTSQKYKYYIKGCQFVYALTPLTTSLDWTHVQRCLVLLPFRRRSHYENTAGLLLWYVSSGDTGECYTLTT